MLIYLFLSCLLLFRPTFSTVSTLAPTYFDSDESIESYYNNQDKELSNTDNSDNNKSQEKFSDYDTDKVSVTYDKKEYLGDVMKYYSNYPNPPSMPGGSPLIKSKQTAGGFGKIDISIEYGCCASNKQGPQNGSNSNSIAQHNPDVTARFEQPSMLGLPRFGFDQPINGYTPVLYPNYQPAPGYMGGISNGNNKNNQFYQHTTTEKSNPTRKVNKKSYNTYQDVSPKPSSTTERSKSKKDSLVAKEQFYSIQQPFYGSTVTPISAVSVKIPGEKSSFYDGDRILPAIPIYSTHIIQPVALPMPSVQPSFYFGENTETATPNSNNGEYYENHVTPRSILHDVGKIVIEDGPYSYEKSEKRQNNKNNKGQNRRNLNVNVNFAKPVRNYQQHNQRSTNKYNLNPEIRLESPRNFTHFRPNPQNFQPEPENYRPAPPANFRPPAQNFRPPTQNFRPPTQNFRPPTQNFRPPNQNFRPPTQNFRPPTENFRPPTENFRSPPQNFAPQNFTNENITENIPEKKPIPLSRLSSPPKSSPNSSPGSASVSPTDLKQNSELFNLMQKQAYDYLIKATLKDFQSILKQKIDKLKLEMLPEERKMLDKETFDKNEELTLKTLDFLTLYERYADIIQDKELSHHMLHDIDRAKEYLSMKLNKFYIELDSFETKEEYIEKFNYYKEREKPPGLMNILYDWFETLASNPSQLDPNKIKQDLLNVMKNEKRYWLLLLKN